MKAFHKGFHVIRIKTRIEATHAINISRQGIIFYLSCIAEICFKSIRPSQFIDGGDSSDQFHCRCWPHQLFFMIAIDRRVRIQVVYHQPQLGCLEQITLHELVKTILYRLRPRSGHTVHNDGVDQRRISLIVILIFNIFIIDLRLQGQSHYQEQYPQISFHNTNLASSLIPP